MSACREAARAQASGLSRADIVFGSADPVIEAGARSLGRGLVGPGEYGEERGSSSTGLCRVLLSNLGRFRLGCEKLTNIDHVTPKFGRAMFGRLVPHSGGIWPSLLPQTTCSIVVSALLLETPRCALVDLWGASLEGGC